MFENSPTWDYIISRFVNIFLTFVIWTKSIFDCYKSLVYFTAYIELGNQYEVLNKQGQPIFFAIDATEWQGMVFDGAPFNLMLLDYDYVEICKIDGQPGQSGRVKGVSRESPFYFS